MKRRCAKAGGHAGRIAQGHGGRVLVLPGGQVPDESLAIMRWALAWHDPGGCLQSGSGTLVEMLTRPGKVFSVNAASALDVCSY